jgi:hypothetical protein
LAQPLPAHRVTRAELPAQLKRRIMPKEEQSQSRSDRPSSPTRKLEGEGSYEGTRRYNKNLERHQQDRDVDELAERARKALEGNEAEGLARAEQEGKLPARRA